MFQMRSHPNKRVSYFPPRLRSKGLIPDTGFNGSTTGPQAPYLLVDASCCNTKKWKYSIPHMRNKQKHI